MLKSKIANSSLNCPLKLEDTKFSACQSPKVRYKFKDMKKLPLLCQFVSESPLKNGLRLQLSENQKVLSNCAVKKYVQVP